MPQPALDTHAEIGKLKQAGYPEKQAEVMVDLVSRAPMNAQIARTLDRMQHRLESIESAMRTMATKSELEAMQHRLESIESAMRTMATKAELEAVRADMIERIESLRADMIERIESLRADTVEMHGATKVRIEALHAQMVRMLWGQGLALATLIISLAGIMLGLAG